MKRLLILVMVILLLVSLISCTSDKGMSSEDKIQKEEREKQTKNSEDLVKTYLELNMQGSFDKAKQLVSEDTIDKKTFDFSNNLKLLGYKIQNTERIGSGIKATVDVITCEKEMPYYSMSNIIYTLNKKNEKILITGSEEKSDLVFFGDNIEGKMAFTIREGKSSEKEPIFTNKELPSYISVKTNNHGEKKVKVGGDSFGAVAISGEGRHMIITSTQNGNTLLLMVQKSQEVMSSNKLIAEGSGSTEGSEDKESIKKTKGKVQIEVEAIDYFENSNVEYIAFSPSNEVIYTQVRKGEKVELFIYSSLSKSIISKNIMEKFNSPEYTINNAYFNNDNSLILQVENVKDKKVENYVLDVLNDKIVKQDQ